MAEHELLEVDVLIVGAGPAGLSCAIRLSGALKAQSRTANILVIEKGAAVGAHSLSGAVLDVRALDELLPEWRQDPGPVRQAVSGEEIWLLSERKKRTLPGFLIPPYLRNHGNFIVSLCEFTPWLAEKAKAFGVEVLEGLAAAELLIENEQVCGVRCRDSGVDKNGQPGGNYTPGADIRAKVTVLAEGSRGSLTKTLVRRLKLQGRHPQTYATGVKELWELPAGRFPAGRVVHTLGFPLQSGLTFSGPFGGSFLYGLDETHLAVGLVVGLDYSDAALDPHVEFNRFKTHPEIKALLSGGKLLAYGAKTIPEGGYYSIPKCSGDGFLIVGDSASYLNAARLKGVHLAMKSGMLAAETIAGALKDSTAAIIPASALAGFAPAFEKSWAAEELRRVRNWRAGYAHGFVAGTLHDLAQRLSGGRGLIDPLPVEADHLRMRKIRAGNPLPVLPLPDGQLTLDKVSDVFLSGTNHAENQPSHLIVPDPKLCSERCAIEYGNPCRNFCPAAVYEWVGAGPAGHLQINAGNCVHCKTCDIKDPYENIEWVVPEGGGGPRYNRL